MMKKLFGIIFTVILSFSLAFGYKLPAFASGDTDVIHNYDITVDVNEDASLNVKYHIIWEVLESDSLGPVTWISLGIPSHSHLNINDYSENIDYITPNYSNGAFLEVYFKDSYYEGETIDFYVDITVYDLYIVNDLTEGETRFTFTPGWFDEINVENLCIKWDMDKALSQEPASYIDDGCYIWETSLGHGSKYTVNVSYPNDAYGFDMSKTFDTYEDDYYYEDEDDSSDALLGFAVLIIIFIVIRKWNKSYSKGTGFTTTTTTKVTRTLVKYYPTCQGCGAAREEGQEKCAYCGRSFIESEETIEESKIEEPSKYKTDGVYRYTSAPNTYIRVHTVPVVIRTPRSSSSSHHSSCAHSSCAHSSCACASHCACACACACAGGGRAGCSTKDFYNTNLKLSQLKKKK